MAPTAAPTWKRKLSVQREHVKRALRYEDPTYFRVRAAVGRYRDSDPKAELTALLGANDPTKDALDNINIANTGMLC
jgi:seryl-tRNA(Sec) selenium transferase